MNGELRTTSSKNLALEETQGNRRGAEAAEIAEESVNRIVIMWVSGARNSNDFKLQPSATSA